MDVRKHMTARPITIAEDTDFKEAMGIMQRHRIRRLPVVDASGALSGIVAERDLVTAADRYLNSPVEVARIMTRQVVTIGDRAPVTDAAALLIERKIGGLPVTDAAGRLLGIITETDLLKALTALLRQGESKSRAIPKRTAKAKTPARKKAAVEKGRMATARTAKAKAPLKPKQQRARSATANAKRAGKR
jgi:acetoin utilization protein AcuB